MARTPQPSRPASGRNAPGRASGKGGGAGAGRGGGKAGGSKAVRQAQKATSGGRNWGLIAGFLALALFVGGVLTFAVLNAGEESPTSLSEQARSGLGDAVQEFDLADDAGSHVQTPVDYEQTPPAGGPHNPVWQNCGVYDTPIASENAVHSLEHGAVWITYDPSLPADQVSRLRDLAGGNDYVLLSPFEGLTGGAVHASAWGLQMQASGVDDPRLAQFITAYQQGPQTPEPGAACSGGTGSPVA